MLPPSAPDPYWSAGTAPAQAPDQADSSHGHTPSSDATTLDMNGTQPGLHLTCPSRLHPASLLTAWAACRHGSRVGLEPRRAQLHNGFQQGRRGGAQCHQHALLVIRQAVIPMCLGMLLEHTAEPQKRLYDFVWEVVR